MKSPIDIKGGRSEADRDWLNLPSVGRRDRGPSMPAIIAAVAERFKVTPEAIMGSRRNRAVVWPRQVAIWLCLLDGTRSSVQVGIQFRRDHTTILHARDRIEGHIRDRRIKGAADANLRRTAAELADALKIRRGFHTVVPVEKTSPVKHEEGA